MSTPVPPIPAGFHSVTPYLVVRGAAEAIEFYREAFGAQERFRMPGPDGKSIGHAEIVIGNSIVMLADEAPGCDMLSPLTLKGAAVSFTVYVPDADAAFAQAVALGATVLQPLEDKFWGDRAGTVQDPFGHRWTFMTHQEEVSAAETERRLGEMYEKMKPAAAQP